MDKALKLSSADLLVLLKLAAHRNQAAPPVRKLQQDLGLSKSSVANSLERLRELALLKMDEQNGSRINRLALRDLLENAVRWLAPARVGDFELGLPTAHSAPPFAEKLLSDDDPLVLPLPHGPVRGRAVSPIHPNAPNAANKDPELLRLLAIVDALRIGRARDRHVAVAELRACL